MIIIDQCILVFFLICRRLGIKCVIIKGVCKSVGYEVGIFDILKNFWIKWNVVWVNDSWRLIYLLWVCQMVVGKFEFNDWMVNDDEEENIEGWMVQKINEFFFFIDLYDFLYFCFFDDLKW